MQTSGSRAGPPNVHGATADDSILPVTRIVAASLVPFLFLAFLILYFQPDNTGENFAWTIQPPMTPMIMGSGYLAGAYYFVRMATGRRWSRMGVALPAVAVFATVMAILTVIHWDRFNHDHLAFYLWVFLYAVAPPLVVMIWLLNRRRDPGPDQHTGTTVPRQVRFVLFSAGVVILAIAVWLFAAPDSAADVWPWTISPLTGRVLAGWFALGGSASLLLARDPRWSAWRIPIETTFAWALLIAIAILRATGDFDWDRAESWLFVAAVATWTASFAILLVSMESRQRQQIQRREPSIS